MKVYLSGSNFNVSSCLKSTLKLDVVGAYLPYRGVYLELVLVSIEVWIINIKPSEPHAKPQVSSSIALLFLQ